MKNDTIIKSETIKEKEIPTTNKVEELNRIVQIISGKKEIEQGKVKKPSYEYTQKKQVKQCK